jgi:hypothetical protein
MIRRKHCEVQGFPCDESFPDVALAGVRAGESRDNRVFHGEVPSKDIIGPGWLMQTLFPDFIVESVTIKERPERDELTDIIIKLEGHLQPGTYFMPRGAICIACEREL